ncbi:MAG: TlpA family protein disulfide reductase [Planctomyces sp.]|nr:TlpA family protein disulfide reductase [Planctomyces sp.]
MQNLKRLFLTTTLVGLMAGCGSDSGSPAAQTGTETETGSGSSETSTGSAQARVTASIPGPATITDQPTSDEPSASNSPDAAAKESKPAEDEVTRILREIQQLRVAAAPADVETARQIRRQRNEEIIEKATNVLRLTMEDKAREPQFNQAIGQLLEARFQMALTGTEDDIQLLHEDVEALSKRDPKSPAAAEGVYQLARLAHTKAGLLGKSQPVWFETLSRWAREFADRFPEQNKRAVTLLFGAARSCELHALATTDAELSGRLMTESKLCYTTLAEKFSTSPQGQEAVAVLRRMAVVGQPLTQFEGPTIDGGFVSVSEFSGRPTLIYFWSAEDEDFTKEVLPAIQKIRTQLADSRLRMVGVPLDDDETELEAFMEQNSLPGQQIFFTNPEQRSWNSPLIRFWGISKTPSIWVLDNQTNVISTNVETSKLVPTLQKVVR